MPQQAHTSLQKNYILDELPMNFKYMGDNGKKVEIITEKEVVGLLCRKEKVPVWIDIAVEAVYKRKTIFRLLCAGRYSDNAEELYCRNEGTGPFGVKSPALPFDYTAGNQFKLQPIKTKSVFSWLKAN